VIGKTHSGAGFGGLTGYLLTGRKDDPHPDRVLWTSTRELALENPREAAVLMRSTAALGNTEKPVQHISISLARGEHLMREQWEQVIDTTLRDLGLEGHQALIVAHQDTKHEHIHLMVNRVHPETYRAWDRWQDRPRLMKSLRPQEITLGLQPTPHVKNPDRLPDGLVQQFERTGEPPLLDYARAAGRQIFREAGSWNELHERLAEKGLYLERKGQGLVVSDDHRQIKASSVDRSASLGAVESRLGPYQERRPVLQEVDRTLRSEVRERELSAELSPLRSAYQERTLAITAHDMAATRLDHATRTLHRIAEGAYRDPAEAAERYLAHLQRGGAPDVMPSELGRLRGSVLHLGRNYLPLGAEGERACQVAVDQMPRHGAEYKTARTALARTERHLDAVRRRLEQLEERFRPQLEELRRLDTRAGRLDLAEEVMSLRPRDQIALARRHGVEMVERAAKRAPELAIQTVAAREEWMRSLAPTLNRALDRQIARRGLPAPTPSRSATWLETALERGLRPAHALQALARVGVPLAETLRATSRALTLTRAVRSHPVKTAAMLTAKALGVPTLPLRLAVLSWELARSVARTLSR
jgi:hypothetical protein